jgi:hypothetical protein
MIGGAGTPLRSHSTTPVIVSITLHETGAVVIMSAINHETNDAFSTEIDRFQVIIALDPHGRAMMVRDMELVRKILLEIQSRATADPKPIEIGDEPDKNKLLRHIEMLHEAGLINICGGIHRGGGCADMILVTDLSWSGHNFIADMEAKGVWNTIKNRFSASEITGMSWGVLKSVVGETAKYLAKSQLGLS